jgi:hypothetical protein
MSDFTNFAALVKAQFTLMSKGELFRVGLSTVENPLEVANLPDLIWSMYLEAFPEGTNPIYRERTEHDCSCCRSFIRHIGNVVSIVDGTLVSIWDIETDDATYKVVSKTLSDYVKSWPITSLFRVSDLKYGALTSKELLDSGVVKTWNHFQADIHLRHYTQDVGSICGSYATTAQVFERGLKELTKESFTTAIELIESNNLYRGEEFLPSLKAFQELQSAWSLLANDSDSNNFIWANSGNPVSRFRNTAIGTFIQDLSEGYDLVDAVKSFEIKVAPTNYKRPTALITPGMVKSALSTIQELGLEQALERRFAKISDITINNVLWADGSVQDKMKGGLESLLLGSVTAPMKDLTSKAVNITIEEFMATVAPQATSMDLLFKNGMQSNLMSLTAPVHEDSKKLFKWGNDFAWSYSGNITDSIKERVKRAGGKVDAVLRVSLAWFNHDDLDIQVIEPDQNLISFRSKVSSYGALDVDMNAGVGTTREPVENVTWHHPQDGVYTVRVNNWSKRNTADVGFVIEVENEGVIRQFTHTKDVRNGETVTVGTIKVSGGKILSIIFSQDMAWGNASKDVWGIQTEKLVKVNTLLQSPNHWDKNATGNKHWFFILDQCKTDEPTRGIYNEFLSSDLEGHRKVFEVLGNKTQCQPTEDQLSGIGFSSTRKDSVLVNVTGAKKRGTFNVTF